MIHVFFLSLCNGRKKNLRGSSYLLRIIFLLSVVLAPVISIAEDASATNDYLQSLLKAAQENPNDINALLNIGTEFISRGDVSKAQFYFTKIKEIDPYDFEVRLKIAKVYYQVAGLEANALEEYWQIIALDKSKRYAKQAQTQLDRLLLGVDASTLSVAEEAEKSRLTIAVDEDFSVDAVPVDNAEPSKHEKHVFLKDFRFSGYLKNETAFRFREPRSFTKIKNIINLEASMPLGSNMNLTASAWAYHDSVYDLFDYDTITARFRREEGQPLVFIEQLKEEKDSDIIDLREFYADIFLGNMDIRIGKQWLVWGVMEGIRIVDEINPYDFRELIMPDLLDFRVPLWTVKVDYFPNWGDVQLVWIPDVRFHKPAPPGTEWELLQAVPNTVTPDRWDPKNSELGIRYSRNIFDTEMSFSYFYTWDDFPVIFRRVRLLENEDPVFFPTYTRIHMFGSTMIRQMGSYILKGEFVYVTNKYFAIANVDKEGRFDANGNPKPDGFLDKDGEVQKDHIRWGVGADFNLFRMDIAPAFTQWVILDYEEPVVQSRFDSSFSLFMRKEFPKQSAVFQFLLIAILSQKEYIARPKITYRLTDKLSVALGVDIFAGTKSRFGVLFRGGNPRELTETGEASRFLGNFHDNDRLFVEFKYAF